VTSIKLTLKFAQIVVLVQTFVPLKQFTRNKLFAIQKKSLLKTEEAFFMGVGSTKKTNFELQNFKKVYL